MTQAKRRLKSHSDGQGGWQRPWGFAFDDSICQDCPLRSQCVSGKKGKGRTVSLHPQEALLQQARALQHSEAFAEYRKRSPGIRASSSPAGTIGSATGAIQRPSQDPVPGADGSYGSQPDPGS